MPQCCRNVLVFDIEKQLFYFEEEHERKIINKENRCRDLNVDVVRRGEEYFGLVLTSWIESYSDEDSDYAKYCSFPVYNELRSYKKENDDLVEKEVIWEGEAKYVRWRKTFRSWIKVFSTVIVDDVYLD